MTTLPDEGEGSSHGGLGDQEGNGEDPVTLRRGSRGHEAGTSGNQQTEEQDRLPSNRVHRQGNP